VQSGIWVEIFDEQTFFNFNFNFNFNFSASHSLHDGCLKFAMPIMLDIICTPGMPFDLDKQDRSMSATQGSTLATALSNMTGMPLLHPLLLPFHDDFLRTLMA
jgi:hypothetical protein